MWLVNFGNGHPFWIEGHRLSPGSRFCLRRCLQAVCAVKSNLHVLSSSVFTAQQNVLSKCNNLEVTLICLAFWIVLAGSASVEYSPFQKFGTTLLPSFACLPVGSGSREWSDITQTATYLLMYWHQKEPG